MNSLYRGDCLEVMSNIDMSNVIIVTDPPFNIGYHYSTYKDKMLAKYDWREVADKTQKHDPEAKIEFESCL